MTWMDVWWIGTGVVAGSWGIIAQVRHTNRRCGAYQRYKREKNTPRTPVSFVDGKGLDYCAGCDGLVVRKLMHWTDDDDDWRCRTCDPGHPKVDPWLEDEIKAAGEALDGVTSKTFGDVTHTQGRSPAEQLQRQLFDVATSAACTVPIITQTPEFVDAVNRCQARGSYGSASGVRTHWSLWPTQAAAKAELRRVGTGTIMERQMDGLTTYVVYRDEQPTPPADDVQLVRADGVVVRDDSHPESPGAWKARLFEDVPLTGDWTATLTTKETFG